MRVEVQERGTPLSPARLSERIGLTSGATSSLLNRLEASGHIEHSRVHADKRIVALHTAPGVQEVASVFFDPPGIRLGSTMSAYPDELVEQLETLLTQLRTTTEAYLHELPS
ncbi:putative transcriptional regulator, MarR family [Arthrobacter sp. PAMC 25486]|uniref:MarR family transcriptional regulator n=1 Tax=Arthrobacter sp. PAMC 25486 TaxID=1494608 RepID=UPI000535E81A|nr:helix-turn-helix domain-containing protein [Arthrobacter sp. PAMC 25486]AIX99747.1 putative transcriptional regulator, MarR family [Arthrobacter sp. PAMC 25486]